MNGATGGPDVRRAVNADVGALVEVLARAFDDDPVPQLPLPGDRARAASAASSPSSCATSTSDAARCGPPRTMPAPPCGPPPRCARPGWTDLVRLVPVVPYLSRPGAARPDVVRLLAAVDRARPTDMHWYLATLGTDPEHQGTGVGSSLCCGRRSTASTPRASPPTSSRPRRAISPSTAVTGSRSPGRSTPRGEGRRCG